MLLGSEVRGEAHPRPLVLRSHSHTTIIECYDYLMLQFDHRLPDTRVRTKSGNILYTKADAIVVSHDNYFTWATKNANSVQPRLLSTYGPYTGPIHPLVQATGREKLPVRVLLLLL